MKKAILILILLVVSLGTSAINLKQASAQGTSIYVDPASIVNSSLTPGSTFTVAIKIDNVVDLSGYEYKLFWKNSVLEFVSVHDTPPATWVGPFVATNQTDNNFDATYGRFYYSIVDISSHPFTGSFTARTVTFRVKSVDSTSLDLQETVLGDVLANNIPHDEVDGFFSNAEVPPQVHDIAVTNVVPSTSSVDLGDSLNIDVTIKNNGDTSESTTVSAYYDSSPIGTQNVDLATEETKTVTFSWTPISVGTFTIKAEASVVAGETHTEDNVLEDGTVVVSSVQPPPPVGGIFNVSWYAQNIVLPPEQLFNRTYYSPEYPLWANFSIYYFGNNELNYISVKYPASVPSLKPSRYEIEPESASHKWTIKVNLDDRLIEFIAELGNGYTTSASRNIPVATIAIKFTEGPITGEHEFAVTLSERYTAAQTFYLYKAVDDTDPFVRIDFPKDGTKTYVYSFVKKRDGYIWVQMPDGSERNIKYLWINGTSGDAVSGINRVEIWINSSTMNRYIDDATFLWPGKIGSNQVSWYYKADPSKDWPTGLAQPETWYTVTARAYDNAINAGQAKGRGDIPATNSADAKSHFFWNEVPGIKVPAWVPGNGVVISVKGLTGFYPNEDVSIYLENSRLLYSRQIGTAKADVTGKFEIWLRLPEVQRAEDWMIRAVDMRSNTASDHFAIVPWITYEDTLPSTNIEPWDTTKEGNVEDVWTVHGHGFAPNTLVEVVFTDVAPLENLYGTRSVWNGSGIEDPVDNLKWSPRLSEVILSQPGLMTDARGYFSCEITIPECYGGLHAIYAREVHGVVSGQPEITGLYEEQAVIFDVYPTIAVSPTPALTNEYLTVTAEGLPLPKYYKLWKNEEAIISTRNWCLVIDFGPYSQWVFENKRIRNNELDQSWTMELWYPFSFYTPDLADHLDSPVWKGKLTSVTTEFTTDDLQFHIGSKFLKVPVLPADAYSVSVYYFDKDTGTFTHDHDGSTMVTVLKDPLNLNIEVGKIHFPSEIVSILATVDVDGIAEDASTINLELYRGNTLVQTLNCQKVAAGAYAATFNCPEGEGDYFVKASATINYEAFRLYGSAISGFTVSPTMNDYNAHLVAMEEDIATLQTDIGQVKVDLASVHGKIASIEGTIATIQTDIGTVKTDVSTVNAMITGLSEDAATIHTTLGNIQVKLNDINKIVNVENDVATITTDLGVVKGKVLSLEGNVAQIQTDIGTVTTKADSIQFNVGFQPITVALTIIAAIAAILAAVMILKKVYSN